MLKAHSTIRHGRYDGRTPADSILLDFDQRRRRRASAVATRGLEFLIDLPEAPVLAHGDAYILEDGRLVEIVAAPEPLLEVRARDPQHQARLAWHLGNRHLDVEIAPRWLRLRADHVIADMLRGLGAKTIAIEAPFQPEGGAYEGGHGHSSQEHGHDHAHDRGRGEHASGKSEHKHGPGCGHAHAHARAHAHAESDASASAQASAHQHGGEHRHGPGCGHDHAREAPAINRPKGA